MLNHETQPTSISILEGLKTQIATSINEFEKAKLKAGQEIKQQVGDKVSAIEEGVLPESIKIADLTPVSWSRPTALNQAKYHPRTNEISLVTRKIAKITNFRFSDPDAKHLDPEEARPIYVPIPEDEQSETTVRVIEDAEWVTFGPSLMDALETAVHRAQGVKKQ